MQWTKEKTIETARRTPLNTTQEHPEKWESTLYRAPLLPTSKGSMHSWWSLCWPCFHRFSPFTGNHIYNSWSHYLSTSPRRDTIHIIYRRTCCSLLLIVVLYCRPLSMVTTNSDILTTGIWYLQTFMSLSEWMDLTLHCSTLQVFFILWNMNTCCRKCV